MNIETFIPFILYKSYSVQSDRDVHNIYLYTHIFHDDRQSCQKIVLSII